MSYKEIPDVDRPLKDIKCQKVLKDTTTYILNVNEYKKKTKISILMIV